MLCAATYATLRLRVDHDVRLIRLRDVLATVGTELMVAVENRRPDGATDGCKDTDELIWCDDYFETVINKAPRVVMTGSRGRKRDTAIDSQTKPSQSVGVVEDDARGVAMINNQRAT